MLDDTLATRSGGVHGSPAALRTASVPASPLNEYLRECRALVLDEIAALMPPSRHAGRLYELMRDYPLREGKAMRPALCIATCRALGGHLEAALRPAAAIELYHNAFLVHDDVEDGSELRRATPTLHRKHGVPIAVNVGDGMLALSMSSLLACTATIGVGRTLRVLDTVSRMARESAEGQMIELDWIASGSWALTDASYIRMVYKKTTWYSFITPVSVGAVAANASNDHTAALTRFATLLGVAFQVQDDVLNLVGSEDHYGKEIGGDLWEGKHTLILIHTLRSASPANRDAAVRILRKRRPRMRTGGDDSPQPEVYRTEEDVAFLRDLVDRCDGIGYASRVAERHALKAARTFERVGHRLPPSTHVDFLRGLNEFVIRRTR